MSHYYIDEVAPLDSEYMRELIEAVILEERMLICSLMAGDHVEFSVVDDPWLRMDEPKPEPRERTSVIAIEAGMRGEKWC